jgi:pimeloyl-ACP methyl ester carboxylesterase
LYFEESGAKNKKTIIFIHGAMWPRSLCRQEVLSDKFHTVFVQMNGHGKEYNHRFAREEIVNEIVDYIKDNNINKPHLVGFSLGTQISIQIVDKYPELIDKVALISPLIDAKKIDISKIKFTMLTLGKLVKIAPFLKIAAKVLKIEKNCENDFKNEMINQNVDELANDIMKERLNLKDLKNIDKINNEFYLAVGVKDAECFIESGKILKKVIKNSVLVVYEKCGHNIPIVGYTKLNSDLRTFFK